MKCIKNKNKIFVLLQMTLPSVNTQTLSFYEQQRNRLHFKRNFVYKDDDLNKYFPTKTGLNFVHCKTLRTYLVNILWKILITKT